MTILLVEDDEDDRKIFRDAVSMVKPHCEVLVAVNGEHGLMVLKQTSQLDYIFLDINMPKMNGREFLKYIKAHEAYKKIPVVIYSTRSHESEIGEYFSMGATNFITKPPGFNLLLTYLKSVLH